MNWEKPEAPLGGDKPFTPDEREELRGIIEKERSARFLWRTLRIWGGGLAAIMATLLAAFDHWSRAK